MELEELAAALVSLGCPPEKSAEMAAQLAESGGYGRCDARFFEDLWGGVTDEFDTLLAALAPYLDRAPEQLSPIEKGVLASNAQLVERAVAIVELLGARVQSSAQVRERPALAPAKLAAAKEMPR